MEDNTLGANFHKHVQFGKNGAVCGKTCVVLDASGVASFFFFAPGRVITVATPNRNYNLKSLFIEYPFIWLTNSKFVESIKLSI